LYNQVEVQKVYASEENMTVVGLSDAARRNFCIPRAKLEFILSQCSLVQVENTQVTFCRHIAQAFQLVGRESQSLEEEIDAFPPPVELDESNDNVKHAIATIHSLKSLVPAHRFYIDPILCAAAAIQRIQKKSSPNDNESKQSIM